MSLKLAIEKDSPIAWWSVLATNIGTTVGFSLLGGGGLLLYWAFKSEDATAAFIFGLVAFALGVRLFFGSLVTGGIVRKARYTGTFEVQKTEKGWLVGLSPRVFRNAGESLLMLTHLTKTLEEMPAESTDENVLVFVVGVDDDAPQDFRVKLVHKCDNDAKCEKPRLHLFGYSEEHDGALYWRKV